MANKKCLVFETLGKISDLQLLNESADGFMRLHGVFGVCGVKNNNNRIYNKQNYGMMVEALQHEITTGSVLGELEHPNSMNITLDNVSHMIESIEMNEDGTITGTIKLLDTPKGKIAQAIAKASGSLYISSRAAGSIDESGNVTLSLLKTYDLVGTPGFSQAKLTLTKGQKFESLCESAEDGNISWMIVEDDDLLSDDNDDEKKKKKDSDSKDDNDEGKSGGDAKEDKSDDNKKSDEEDKSDNKSEDKEDNNKNNDNDATMNDLKEAIDKLSEKIESLEADLHVAQESLTEKNEQINKLNEQLDKVQSVDYSKVEKWVKEEFAPEFKSDIVSEVESSFNESITNATEQIAEGVQDWAINEFGTKIESWVCEEFAPMIEGYLTEEFAPMMEGYITEEVMPEMQTWVNEEFAPMVEGWINEELMPTVDAWINEECLPEHKETIVNEVNNNVSEFFEAKSADKLTSIDALLEAIEGKNSNIDEALDALKNQQDEDKFKGIYCVESMPAQYKAQWTMLSEAKQQEIIRSSRMYDFTKAGILENFWASVDFTEKAQPVVENQVPENSHYNAVFERMMNLRH